MTETLKPFIFLSLCFLFIHGRHLLEASIRFYANDYPTRIFLNDVVLEEGFTTVEFVTHTVQFRAEPGDKMVIEVEDIRGTTGVAGYVVFDDIVYSTTDSYNRWLVKFNKNDTLNWRIDSVVYKMVGMSGLEYGLKRFNFSFVMPYQSQCSNATTPYLKQEDYLFTFEGLLKHVKAEEVSTKNKLFVRINDLRSIQGELKLLDDEAVLDYNYPLEQVLIYHSPGGTDDVIEFYGASISGDFSSTICTYTIRTCHKHCESCSTNTNTGISHQCITCKPGHGFVADMPSNCEKCYSLCNSCDVVSLDRNEHKCTSCLPGYFLDEENGKGNCLPSKDANITLPDLPDYMPDYPIENSSSIETDNSTIDYYPSDEGNPNNTRPSVDLGQCERVLRDAYKIPDDERLIIGQITDTSSNNPTQPFEYIVMDIRGNVLDVSLCKYINITTSSPIDGGAININESLYLELLGQGIDIYDNTSAFYSDACLSASYNSKDIQFSIRPSLYVALCQEGCFYESLQLNPDVLHCKCSSKRSVSAEKPSAFNSTNNIDETAKLLFNCAYLVTQFSSSLSLVWSQWILLVFELCFIPLVAIYWVKYHYRLKAKLLSYIKANPPSNLRSDFMLVDSSSSSHRRIAFKQTHEQGKLNNNFEVKNAFTYLESLKEDDRSYWRTLFDHLKALLIIFSIPLGKNQLSPSIIQCCLLLTLLLLLFLANTFFYAKSYIGDRFYNEITLAYVCKHELLKSLYASLVALGLFQLIKQLIPGISYSFRVNAICNNKFDIELVKYFRRIKYRFMTFHALSSGIGISVWYFSFVFSSLYPNNQSGLVIAAAISFVMYLMIIIVLSFITSIMRYVGLKYRKR